MIKTIIHCGIVIVPLFSFLASLTGCYWLGFTAIGASAFFGAIIYANNEYTDVPPKQPMIQVESTSYIHEWSGKPELL